MITKRIIPCLDVRDGRVVKGVNFRGLSDVSSPVELAKYYSDNGADELVFYDITASFEERRLFTDILREVASKIFIPLTVGGGINTLDDFERVLTSGADKVSVNSGAIRNPSLVGEAAKKYGTPLEINLQGIKLDRQYPNDVFWKIAGEVGCGAVMGTDAHSPSRVYDGRSLEKAMELIEKYNLNYIERPKIVNIQ